MFDDSRVHRAFSKINNGKLGRVKRETVATPSPTILNHNKLCNKAYVNDSNIY